MRWAWIAIVVGACEYTTPSATVDAAADAPPDMFVDPRGRVTENLIGLWEFDDGGGGGGNVITETVMPSPAVAPTITLNGGIVMWLPTSLQIDSPVSIRTAVEPNRLLEACALSNAVTLEAWVTTPSNTQIGIGNPPEPARIVSFAPENSSNHPISLGQLNAEWHAQVRTGNAAVGVHGGPALKAPSETGVSTHLVVTSDMTARKLYINGLLVTEDALGGELSAPNWASNRALVFAGEPSGTRGWVGTFHLVAMYDRALDADEVMKNRMAGP